MLLSPPRLSRTGSCCLPNSIYTPEHFFPYILRTLYERCGTEASPLDEANELLLQLALPPRLLQVVNAAQVKHDVSSLSEIDLSSASVNGFVREKLEKIPYLLEEVAHLDFHLLDHLPRVRYMRRLVVERLILLTLPPCAAFETDESVSLMREPTCLVMLPLNRTSPSRLPSPEPPSLLLSSLPAATSERFVICNMIVEVSL